MTHWGRLAWKWLKYFKRFFLENRPTTRISKRLIESDDESEKRVNYLAVCQVICDNLSQLCTQQQMAAMAISHSLQRFSQESEIAWGWTTQELVTPFNSSIKSKVFSFVSFFCSAIRGNFIFFLNYRSLQDQRLGMFFNSNIFISRSRSQAIKIQIWIKCMKLSAMCA